MMIRATTAAVGLVSAGVVAMYEALTAAPPVAMFGWSLLGGVAGAGVAWGTLKGRVASAHKRISETNQALLTEKNDREAAVRDLKADVNRGFDNIERSIDRNTKVMLAALRGQEVE